MVGRYSLLLPCLAPSFSLLQWNDTQHSPPFVITLQLNHYSPQYTMCESSWKQNFMGVAQCLTISNTILKVGHLETFGVLHYSNLKRLLFYTPLSGRLFFNARHTDTTHPQNCLHKRHSSIQLLKTVHSFSCLNVSKRRTTRHIASSLYSLRPAFEADKSQFTRGQDVGSHEC